MNKLERLEQSVEQYLAVNGLERGDIVNSYSNIPLYIENYFMGSSEDLNSYQKREYQKFLNEVLAGTYS